MCGIIKPVALQQASAILDIFEPCKGLQPHSGKQTSRRVESWPHGHARRRRRQCTRPVKRYKAGVGFARAEAYGSDIVYAPSSVAIGRGHLKNFSARREPQPGDLMLSALESPVA